MFRSKHFASRHFKAVWPSVIQEGYVPLYAISLSVASPSIGLADFHQRHSLVPTWLTIASPDIGHPDFQGKVALAALGFSVGSPSLGLPILSSGIVYALQANSFAVGSPVIGQADFHQRHSLLPTWLTVGSPSIGRSALHQHHLLMANLLAIASPSIGSPQFRSPALPVYIYEKIYLEGRADSTDSIEGRGGKE